MLAAAAKPLVRLVESYMPDPYIFVVLLTFVIFGAAVAFEGHSPLAVAVMWGDGLWGLLSFAMQMLLVLVTGFMLASTLPVKRLLRWLAGFADSPGKAIVLVSVVALIANWINWGFGLVVGAFFARELARTVKVDYRLLVASAYSGFVIWHGGLSGSIPLSIATDGHPFEGLMGIAPTAQTTFSALNLVIVAILFAMIPLVNRLMLPAPADSVYADPKLFVETEVDDSAIRRPADRLETSRTISAVLGVLGIVYLASHFLGGGGLSLDIVNLVFLTLAILLHGTPRRLLASLAEAIKGGAGIAIQFPLYAGILGVMQASGLAESISSGLISIASPATFEIWVFLSAGLVNLFIPSGGGQWAMQAPVILPVAQALDIDVARVALAVAWGDAWTSLVQPFWALPMLAIAGLQAKDIMGYCLILCVLVGVVVSAVFFVF